MIKRGYAVRIDMELNGKITVYILDSWYEHGVAFSSSNWTSMRQIRRFLSKYEWIPKYFIIDNQFEYLGKKAFKMRYPRPGQSTTTYFHASVRTTAKVLLNSWTIGIEKAGSPDPTVRVTNGTL